MTHHDGTIGSYRDALVSLAHLARNDPDGRGVLLREAISALTDMIEESPNDSARAWRSVSVAMEVSEIDASTSAPRIAAREALLLR